MASRSEWVDLVFGEVAGYDAVVHSMVDSILVVLNRYQELCKHHILAPHNFLVHGNPGTGKSYIVDSICRHSKLPYTVINSPDIFRPNEGDSEKELFEAFQSAQRKAPSFLIFDQVDSIASSRDKLTSLMEKRVSSQFSDLLAENNSIKTKKAPVFVIGITSRKYALDGSLLSYGSFDRDFEIKIPNPNQRFQILKFLTSKMGCGPEIAETIAPITHAFVPSDLQSLCSRALLLALRESGHDKNTVVTQDHFRKCLENIHPSILSEHLSKAEPASLEDIGGLDEILSDIKATIIYPLAALSKAAQQGSSRPALMMRMPRGVLLYGPSGCGKTLLARSFLNNREYVNFISVQSTEVISKVVGESEKTIRNIFSNVRASAPCVLFLDQLESIARVRGFDSAQSNTADRILSCLLTEIDGISADNEANPVIVLGATSRPDLVDPAILRPGRFDTHLFVPPPNEQARLYILQKLTKKMAATEDVAQYLPQLAKDTHFYSGADLDSLCREAGLQCMREDLSNTAVRREHFEKAKSIVPPSLQLRDYVQIKPT